MTKVDTDSKLMPRTAVEDSPPKELVLDMDIALLGNGMDENLSQEQRTMIDDLYERVSALRVKLAEELPQEADFCDHETCRRYLVARQWNLDKAESQLNSTLTWRLQQNPARLDFWQSPKPLQDPFSLSMRVIGVDQDGRPIAYTCFAEAHDRWDVEANMQHMLLLMDASSRLLLKKRARGENQTASSRQWTWVVDFDGFCWRDQNPKSAVVTAKLMQHFPEMLHLAVLINAPKLFSGVYKLIRPILDERVRNKILFQRSEEAVETLQERLGVEATEWILAETRDNQSKRNSSNRKRYWVAPQGDDEHDPRGMRSYVGSDLYIKTPGDAFLDMKQS